MLHVVVWITLYDMLRFGMLYGCNRIETYRSEELGRLRFTIGTETEPNVWELIPKYYAMNGNPEGSRWNLEICSNFRISRSRTRQ